MFNGRRQPSCDGTSRMTRECQVRICERLGVLYISSAGHGAWKLCTSMPMLRLHRIAQGVLRHGRNRSDFSVTWMIATSGSTNSIKWPLYSFPLSDCWLHRSLHPNRDRPCVQRRFAASNLKSRRRRRGAPRTHQQATAQSPRRRLMRGAFPKSKGAQRSDPAPLFSFLGCERSGGV
jgi:hypothetical protein